MGGGGASSYVLVGVSSSAGASSYPLVGFSSSYPPVGASPYPLVGFSSYPPVGVSSKSSSLPTYVIPYK